MNLYRIINPINRVIDIREAANEGTAFGWLLQVQSKRKDPFLEIQAKVGRSWVTLTPPEK